MKQISSKGSAWIVFLVAAALTTVAVQPAPGSSLGRNGGAGTFDLASSPGPALMAPGSGAGSSGGGSDGSPAHLFASPGGSSGAHMLSMPLHGQSSQLAPSLGGGPAAHGGEFLLAQAGRGPVPLPILLAGRGSSGSGSDGENLQARRVNPITGEEIPDEGGAPAPIPEPSSLVLFGAGLLVAGGAVRRGRPR